MYIFVLSVHIVLCLVLILVILMQPGKGADVSSAFGGGASSQLFGASGPGNFLTRGTGAVAGLFFVTSVALTFLAEDEAGVGGGASDKVEDVQGEGEEGAGFGVGGGTSTAPTPSAPEAPSMAPAPVEAPAGGAPVDGAPAGEPAAPGNAQ